MPWNCANKKRGMAHSRSRRLLCARGSRPDRPRSSFGRADDRQRLVALALGEVETAAAPIGAGLGAPRRDLEESVWRASLSAFSNKSDPIKHQLGSGPPADLLGRAEG